jgi:aminotransferase EvaB
MKALDIGPGDEVITVANTAIPTVSSIVSTGATPRFVDIDPASYLMDISRIEEAITPKTKCVIPVHLFGQCVDMERLEGIARARGVHIVEDCAQCHGALHRGRMAGSMGILAAFSFYPTKVLGAYGDGGLVLTGSAELAKRLRGLRMYGTSKTYYAEEHGYNSRLDELHAEILLRKLKRLDGYIARRRELAARYDAKLAGTDLTLPKTLPGNRHAYYLYVVRHPARDRIMERLAARNILVNVSYPHPVHLMRAYSFLGYKESQLPHTEAVAKEIFSLPMYPTLTEAEQDTVCAALEEILAREL